MDYSVVSTIFNDENKVCAYLDDICNQSVKPKEIVIADGGSSDKTIEVLLEYAKSSTVPIRIVQKGRLNISQGYNEAIKNATSEYIGITGIGNRYDCNYFACLLSAFDEKDWDIVYSPIRGYDGTDFMKRYNNSLLNGCEGLRLQIASNHGAIVKKKVFEELGYFYEHFVYAGEDAEFYWRANKAGYKSLLVSDAKVFWETPKTNKEFLNQIRVYTIADLQINGKSQWNRVMKFSVMLLLIIAIFSVLVVSLIITKSKLLLCAIVSSLVAIIISRKNKLDYFHWMRICMPVYYTIKYRKYMEHQYIVKR